MARRSAFTTFAAFKNPLVPFFFAFLLVGDRLCKKPPARPSTGAASESGETTDVELVLAIVASDMSIAADDALESSVLGGVRAALAEVERNGGLAGRHVRLAPGSRSISDSSSSSISPTRLVVDLAGDRSALDLCDEFTALSYERALQACEPSLESNAPSLEGYLAARRFCAELERETR